jgi:hypothetical protein
LIAETGFRAQPNSDRPVKLDRPAQGGFLCYAVHSNVGQWTGFLLVRAGVPVSTELPAGETRFPLYAEDLTVSKRQLAGDRVQVSTVTSENAIFVDETLNTNGCRSIEYRLAVRSMPYRPFDRKAIRQFFRWVEETIVIEAPPYSERRSPHPASSCVGEAPGSCAPAKAGGSGHSHRASQLGTSGRNRCLTIPS